MALTNEEADLKCMGEAELIEIARTGNNDAFGELVRRYRSKAMTWAQMLAKDTNLAEDIVQEAFLKAFMHMGTLIDARRFQAWLRTIVRNQARMNLRRGGLYKGEQLFSCLEKKYTSNETINFHDIDHILYHLTQRVNSNIHFKDGNPEKLIMQKEMLEGIHDLLNCLTTQERKVFEAYFFQQISPKEIAGLFGLSMKNIYTTLSRSRVKVKRERTRIYLRGYIKEQLGQDNSKRKVLAVPITM